MNNVKGSTFIAQGSGSVLNVERSILNWTFGFEN